MIRSNQQPIFRSFNVARRCFVFVLFASIAVQGLVIHAQKSDSSDDSQGLSSYASRLKQTEKQKTKSLESVKKIHNHPLYMMTYHGDYDCQRPLAEPTGADQDQQWACSIFFAFGNKDKPLYGRNFDWQNNPALLLFTDPSDGYASISMVDVSYLGYSRKDKKFDTNEGRTNLLIAPMLPFDGMNEHGLTIGMAAVPTVKNPTEKEKPTVGSLQIIRIMLDKAKNVDEALELIKKHNVQFSGGPQIHYLMADPSGASAVVEFKGDKIKIIRGDSKAKWQAATNFHLTGNEGKEAKQCRRFAQIQNLMKGKKGNLSIKDTFNLLRNVSQRTTRWSVVYDMKGQTAHVAMSRKFNKPLEYKIKQIEQPKK